MPRGIDHIVHAVRDLDAAGERYTALGFTVGARNRHPWGTHNRIVQFPGVFIELLEVAERHLIPPSRAGVFSFGDFNRAFLEGGEGLSMLVLESKDAIADQAAFKHAGIGRHDPFHFEREGKRADGSPVKVAFSLAFATDPQSATGFFVCQQHYPENFWSAELQRHANGVTGIAGVVFVARQPEAHAGFFKAFADTGDVQTEDALVHVRTPRGEIDVLSPDGYRARFGAPPDTATGSRLVAIRFSTRVPQRTIIPPESAHGAALIFEPLATNS